MNEEPKSTRGRKKKIETIQIQQPIQQAIPQPVQNDNVVVKESNSALSVLIVGFLMFMLMVAVLIIFVAYINKVSNKNTTTKSSNTGDIKLQYTETTDKIKEGIYITDVSEVVDNVMPSIVAITSKTLVSSGYLPFYGNQSQYQQGAGSGIIVSKSDTELMILTNNHVVSGASELTVKFCDDKSVDAKIKGTAKNNDVAIITVDLSDMDESTLASIRIATLGDSSTLRVGEGVIAIGNALGYGQSVTTGVVSAVDRVVTVDSIKRKMIQIDAAINGGNSGGALLNSKGEVVGINSAKYSSNGYSSSASIEGMGFAIPITDVSELITNLMNGEEGNDSTHGIIGVQGYVVTDEMSAAYGLPKGYYITDIVEGSGADKAKLEIGQIIYEIEGKTVSSQSDFTDVLLNKKAGDKVTLKIKYASGRTYKEKEVEVTLS